MFSVPKKSASSQSPSREVLRTSLTIIYDDLPPNGVRRWFFGKFGIITIPRIRGTKILSRPNLPAANHRQRAGELSRLPIQQRPHEPADCLATNLLAAGPFFHSCPDQCLPRWISAGGGRRFDSSCLVPHFTKFCAGERRKWEGGSGFAAAKEAVRRKAGKAKTMRPPTRTNPAKPGRARRFVRAADAPSGDCIEFD